MRHEVPAYTILHTCKHCGFVTDTRRFLLHKEEMIYFCTNCYGKQEVEKWKWK